MPTRMKVKPLYTGVQLGEAGFCFQFCFSSVVLTWSKVICIAVISHQDSSSLGSCRVRYYHQEGNGREMGDWNSAQRISQRGTLSPAPGPARRKEGYKVLFLCRNQGLAMSSKHGKGKGLLFLFLFQFKRWCSP